MLARKSRFLPLAGLAVIISAANAAWALGLQLGETKEQLKLDYQMFAVAHQSGRVSVSLTIADQGRLKPLSSVELVVPSQDGTGFVDLSVPLARREVDGKLVVTAHLKRDLAERASIQLNTRHLDGKETPLTWYFHSIPVAKHIKPQEQK